MTTHHNPTSSHDISDPSKPRLTGQVWVGGLSGNAPKFSDATDRGGPQMLQLSLDGKRIYVTDSLFSSWDNQFYPKIVERGSLMLTGQANVAIIAPRDEPDFGPSPLRTLGPLPDIFAMWSRNQPGVATPQAVSSAASIESIRAFNNGLCYNLRAACCIVV